MNWEADWSIASCCFLQWAVFYNRYLLFYGQDGEGNYVPSKKLREKYKRERRDVYWSESGGN